MLAYGMKSGEGKYLIGGDGDGVVEDVTDLGEGVVSLLLDLVDSELVLLNLSGELLDLGSEVVAGLLGLLLLADLDSGGRRRAPYLSGELSLLSEHVIVVLENDSQLLGR